ncbi:MAG: hypothetical protein IJ006_06290, partial [Lachnospiraceae bacterium]|nr:hypothetical protein [Lachnospiraceae bacterium]
TILSISLSIACFVYMFEMSIGSACAIGAVALVVFWLGFWIEKRSRYIWNTRFNKILYYLTKNDKKYIVLSKQFTYTYLGNNEYESKKDITVYPTSNDLDRITERFAWSAPSGKAIIEPLVKEHQITSLGKQELWTCFCIYFGRTCPKRVAFDTGAVIRNLIDENGEAVPFLSASLDRKTKSLVLRVCFEAGEHPERAVFKVFHKHSMTKEIYSEELLYDMDIKGFFKVIDFPRQSWRYVITWED